MYPKVSNLGRKEDPLFLYIDNKTFGPICNVVNSF